MRYLCCPILRYNESSPEKGLINLQRGEFYEEADFYKGGLMRIQQKLKMWTICGLAILLLSVGSRLAAAKGSENVTFATKDGVRLAATYFKSDVKKKAAPVIILHDYKESRTAYARFAQRLQKPSGDGKSMAVLTVDLRGHGGSLKQRSRNRGEIELDAAKLRKRDFENMVNFDMEAIRGFLVGKNDKEEINLNKLSIIGIGLGASIATNWAANDWSVPPLAVGKQGQDVKALVMVSPRWKNRGLLMQRAIRQPGVQRRVALMLIFGRDDRDSKADVLRIKKQVEKYHPEPVSNNDAPRDLVGLAVPNTRLRGGKLLSEAGERVMDRVADFLNTHVVKKDHEWSKRRSRI